MKLLKEFRLTVIIFCTILALVGFRTLRSAGFKYDARKQAKSSFTGANMVNEEKLSGMEGEKLMLDLDHSYSPEGNIGTSILMIRPDSVLNDAVLVRLRKNKGPVIICSSDEGLAAKVWMVLAQTGVRPLYILLPKGSKGTLKNEFRSDTISGPEL